MFNLQYNNVMNGNIALIQLLQSGNKKNSNSLMNFEEKINYYKTKKVPADYLIFNILGLDIYLSNEILYSINNSYIFPSNIYYLNYNNNKNILIGYNEYYNFKCRYFIFKNLYSRVNLNRRNRNNELNKLIQLFDGKRVEDLENEYNLINIYNSLGEVVFTNIGKNNLFDENLNISNNVNNPQLKLFIELLYIIIFYKKYNDKLNKLYNILLRIPHEFREPIVELMKQVKRFYQNTEYPNLEINDETNLHNLEDPNELLKLFKYKQFINNDRLKEIIFNYIITGNLSM